VGEEERSNQTHSVFGRKTEDCSGAEGEGEEGGLVNNETGEEADTM